MRFPLFFAMLVIGIAMLSATPDANAKHHCFANVHPLLNYVHRCLGVGWSDGYHAAGGWTRPERKQYGSPANATIHPRQDVARPVVVAPTFQQPTRAGAAGYDVGN
ncbi:MAG: hypothetical protein ACQESR_04115 [Planctomycetota bacterium]